MSDTITLMCLVRGESSDHAFTVRINKSEFVADLKKLIKAEKQQLFDGIDPDNLTLWRVFIPVENDAILQKLVLENANGVQKLHPTEEVSDVFSETPPKKHIHIIVEPPGK